MLIKFPPQRPCNPEALLDAVDRDFATFQEMVELFHVAAATQIGEMATAIVAGDAERVVRAAQAMQTSLSIVGAVPALEVVTAIAHDPRAAAREAGPGVMAQLMAAVLAADGELRRFCIGMCNGKSSLPGTLRLH
jgi:hypothetical protein